MSLVSQQQAQYCVTSANIPRGLLLAGGAREKDDSEVPPPPPEEEEEEELWLEEDPVVGRKRVQSQNKASFVQFSLFYLVS